jgi:hypothetical protein
VSPEVCPTHLVPDAPASKDAFGARQRIAGANRLASMNSEARAALAAAFAQRQGSSGLDRPGLSELGDTLTRVGILTDADRGDLAST